MGLDNLKGLFSDNMALRSGMNNSRREKSNQTDELKANAKGEKGARGGDDDPNLFLKADLEALQAKISRFGGKLPAGLERVIAEFDKVDTDNDGKVSKSQLQAYAAANGFKLPRLGSREALHNLILSRPDGTSTFNRREKNDDAVDLSRFNSTLGLLQSTENASAASALLRTYTARGTIDLSDAEPAETGILPILGDTKA